MPHRSAGSSFDEPVYACKMGIAKQMEDERNAATASPTVTVTPEPTPAEEASPTPARRAQGNNNISCAAVFRRFFIRGMPMERRITVFCGNFGSGKTELAYAYSKALRQGGEPVTLVDLDLVNPYFTSGNQRSALAEQGIG